MPNYPHPEPNPELPFEVMEADPDKVNEIPDLLVLEANVSTWLGEVAPGVRAQSRINFGDAHCVLVLGNGKLKSADNPREKATVFNGRIPHPPLNALYRTRPFPDDEITCDNDYELVEVSQCLAGGGQASAKWMIEDRRIYVNAHVETGAMVVHEYFHTFDVDGNGPELFGWDMDEGFTDYFARDVAKRFDYPYKGNSPYNQGYSAVKTIVDAIGLDKVCKLYFERPDGLIGALGDASKRISNTIANFRRDADIGARVARPIQTFLDAAQKQRNW
ncbi:hypothetical protein [Aquisphaera insulae]|uniref:hypothetical protein n=1 Tax=Aquisphaera insulae TaxID=2712864 RepID=UPI0013EDFAA1|nr:hypothetical protein [Aquisphaera insulae]